MKNQRLALVVLGGAALLFPACSGGGGGGSSSSGSGGTLDLQQASNGFGQLLPHTVFELDQTTGLPTQNLVAIRSSNDLIKNITSTNPVQPVPQWPTAAILPNGEQGNHFLYAEFTEDVDINSFLDASSSSQTLGGLTGAVSLVALDPNTGDTQPIPARVFVGQRYVNAGTGAVELFAVTYAGGPLPTTPPTVELQKWIKVTDTGAFVPVDVGGGATPGVGFPGSDSQFTGYSKLISPHTIVFVADTDGVLSTPDTFPVGKEIRLRISTSLKSVGGKSLKRRALACSTVGTDTLRPEVLTAPPPINQPVITPGGGDINVDTQTSVIVEFTEPVQPLTVGSLPTGKPPVLSSSVRIEFGPSSARVRVPFTGLPPSVFDLSTWELTPAFGFPGEGPADFSCGVFNRVDVTVNSAQIKDLAAVPNQNILGPTTFFTTGVGPGLVNAPVTPDAIYIGRSGAVPGLSVIDLNGFGQSTGIPTFDSTYTTFGTDAYDRTNFPNNPNVRLQGSLLRPALTPGTCTVNGGSSGVFTLTRDSSLNKLLIRAPLLTAVGDMMLGHGLDTAFNNGPAPFGCQSGGGNLCASDGKKRIAPVSVGSGNTMAPAQPNQFGNIADGAENLMGWAPHPNPPPLIFPPICVSPYIGGQEPTSVDTITAGVTNLLSPGNAFGQPLIGVPPSGLLTPEQNSFFQGPSIEQSTVGACADYQIRQQIGQFLYIIDRARREIVVLNSNRMTVVDRIPTFDPTALAMSPNLNFLAVVNQLSDLVSFIDIDPASATFHTVVKETIVGSRPRGIAWDPGNEDVLIANEGDNSVSILSASSLTLRKVVRSQLNQPFEVAITPRQPCFSLSRNVYLAYILNRNGRLAIFESGPSQVNGWGYDDVIGIATQTFRSPKAMQCDPIDLRSAVWIAHEGPINLFNDAPGPFGIGAMSKIVLTTGTIGQLPLSAAAATAAPQFRDVAYTIPVSIGTQQLSGVPVDMAFDDLRVLSGLPNFVTTFSAGSPVQINGKNLVRGACPQGGVFNTNEPKYMFVAVPNSLNGTGVVDVILFDGTFGRVDTDPFHAGVQSIDAPNVQVVMDFFRQ